MDRGLVSKLGVRSLPRSPRGPSTARLHHAETGRRPPVFAATAPCDCFGIRALVLAGDASLRDVQDAGHRDPRTTRRDDLARNNLDPNATYILALYLA